MWYIHTMECYSAMLVTHSCLTLQPHGLQPTGLLCPWDSPGKDTRVCCHSLLQIFLTQVSNPGLSHCRQILYHLSHQEVAQPKKRKKIKSVELRWMNLEPVMQTTGFWKWEQIGRKPMIYTLQMCAQLLQSCLPLCEPMDCSPLAPLFMGFSRQEYWSGVLCHSSGGHTYTTM